MYFDIVVRVVCSSLLFNLIITSSRSQMEVNCPVLW